MSQANIKEIIKQEYIKCYSDTIHFFRKYCYITHPIKGRVLFHLYPFQEDVLHEFNVSAVFVDGSHHYVDVVNDYKLAMDLLNKKRGIICFDDLQVPDVAKAVEEFEVFAHDRITEKIVMGPYLTNRIFRIKWRALSI